MEGVGVGRCWWQGMTSPESLGAGWIKLYGGARENTRQTRERGGSLEKASAVTASAAETPNAWGGRGDRGLVRGAIHHANILRLRDRGSNPRTVRTQPDLG
jgi:hypothetical protein